jgi:hypothetical protein
LAACLFVIGASTSAAAFLDCNQQSTLTRPIQLGVSGGNISSFFKMHRKKFCFGGTLGSMVQDQSAKQFILSNNHVLADLNAASPGQLIVQPGLDDTDCAKSAADSVATFSRTVKINFGGTNAIDAAIAAAKSGDVSADILNIGPIASTVATPTIGLAVQKMGRTTCLTSGTIAAVNVKATVGYEVGGKVRGAKFANQIRIDDQDFGSAGDSGSLIVTQDACPRAVALLFAGSADQSTTLANPISAVLKGLGVSMVGNCIAKASGTLPSADEAENAAPAKDVVDSATAVRDRHEDELMSIPGAVGTGIGMGERPGEPAIEVYVKKMTPEAQAAAPKDVDGVQVKLIENGGFVAY